MKTYKELLAEAKAKRQAEVDALEAALPPALYTTITESLMLENYGRDALLARGSLPEADPRAEGPEPHPLDPGGGEGRPAAGATAGPDEPGGSGDVAGARGGAGLAGAGGHQGPGAPAVEPAPAGPAGPAPVDDRRGAEGDAGPAGGAVAAASPLPSVGPHRLVKATGTRRISIVTSAVGPEAIVLLPSGEVIRGYRVPPGYVLRDGEVLYSGIPVTSKLVDRKSGAEVPLDHQVIGEGGQRRWATTEDGVIVIEDAPEEEGDPFRVSSSTRACSSCGADIRWATTIAGKKMPLDPTPIRVSADPGRLTPPNGLPATVLLPGEGEVRRMYTDAKSDIVGYGAHWATCPSAQQHRKRG